MSLAVGRRRVSARGGIVAAADRRAGPSAVSIAGSGWTGREQARMTVRRRDHPFSKKI